MAVLILVLNIYCLLVTILWFGWHHAIRITKVIPASPQTPLISVIVAFRNEAHNLEQLTRSLYRQRYKNFEILFVDDHSTDHSVELLMKDKPPRFRILQNGGEGKKSAITTGVREANGSLIVTTDADCIVPEMWLNEFELCFRDERTKMAFGGVKIITGHTFFSVLQSIEFSSLIGSGAATAAMGLPTMCNGASLAYRKTLFEGVRGYEGNEGIASGDDEFLMRKIHAQFPRGVRFLSSAAAMVETKAQENPAEFFSQRLRWAGKWKENSSFFSRALALFILISQIATLTGMVSLIFGYNTPLLVAIGVKMILEAMFLTGVCRWMKVKWSWIAFVVLQFIYPWYVIVVSIASTLFSPSWKGRRIKNQISK
jgi:cellulose synthase/poly-beta-1,6-N-acetylglucosamine synthase-like glycosyltransferase